MPNCSEKTEKNFFIGANTSSAFIDCAAQRLKSLDKLFIIKGGPGTGKSTILKEITRRAEALGYNTERYYCSSDNHSLDAIIVPDLKTGIADGTSPHIMEPSFPGVAGEIIDTGKFWDRSRLNKHRERIIDLSTRKSGAFSSVYRLLSAAETILKEEEARLINCFNFQKAREAVKRIFKHIKPGNSFSLSNAQVSSFGMNGPSYFDTYEKLAKNLYNISDKRGLSSFLFNIVMDEAKSKKLTVLHSIDPLMRTDAILLPEISTAFVTSGHGTNINTERFVIKESYSSSKHSLKFLSYLKTELMNEAQLVLEHIKKIHFELEDIYSDAMDYVSLNEMTEEFISSVLGL